MRQWKTGGMGRRAVIQCLAHRRELNPELVRPGAGPLHGGFLSVPNYSTQGICIAIPGRGEHRHFWLFSPFFSCVGRRQEILVAC